MCALPSAQLGSMSSLSVPSFIPTVAVPKEPKAWEKALLALITNAGSAMLSQGIQNVMQPDFAPQPASGVDKFLSGPKISQSRASELERQVIDKEKTDATARENRLNRMVQQTGQNRQAMLDTQRLTKDVQGQISTLGQNVSDEEIKLAQLEQSGAHQRLQDLVAELNMRRQGRLVDAQIRELDAQVGTRKADADAKSAQTLIMKRSMNDDARKRGQPPPFPEVETTKAVENFASGAAGLTPKQQRVQDNLKDTKRYPTAEQTLPSSGFGGIVASRDYLTEAPDVSVESAITPDVLQKLQQHLSRGPVIRNAPVPLIQNAPDRLLQNAPMTEEELMAYLATLPPR